VFFLFSRDIANSSTHFMGPFLFLLFSWYSLKVEMTEKKLPLSIGSVRFPLCFRHNGMPGHVLVFPPVADDPERSQHRTPYDESAPPLLPGMTKKEPPFPRFFCPSIGKERRKFYPPFGAPPLLIVERASSAPDSLPLRSPPFPKK